MNESQLNSFPKRQVSLLFCGSFLSVSLILGLSAHEYTWASVEICEAKHIPRFYRAVKFALICGGQCLVYICSNKYIEAPVDRNWRSYAPGSKPALPFTSCVILGQLFNLSGLQ